MNAVDKIKIQKLGVVYQGSEGFTKDIKEINSFLEKRMTAVGLEDNIFYKDIANSKFGIGVIFSNLLDNYFFDLGIPIVFVPMNLTENLKIEPEIGYYQYSDKNEYRDNTLSKWILGLGVFGKNDKKKTSLYYGIRLGLIKQKYTVEQHNTSAEKREETRKLFYWGPAVGGEYFFSPHFSLGTEVGFRNKSVESDTEEEGNSLGYLGAFSDERGIRTHIFLRFYF